MANDNWSGQDKAQHFIASAMLSAAGNEYSQHQGMSRDRSAMFGLMFSVSLGASKELWDSRPEGSGWSWKDFAWDIAGAVFTAVGTLGVAIAFGLSVVAMAYAIGGISGCHINPAITLGMYCLGGMGSKDTLL